MGEWTGANPSKAAVTTTYTPLTKKTRAEVEELGLTVASVASSSRY